MEYGYFSRDGTEYHLKRLVTPRFWQQFLHNDQYGLTVAQTGHGYSWYRTMRSYRVTMTTDTNYSPTSPNTGRFLYIHDEETGRCWHVNPQMFEKQDEDFTDWTCIYGLTYVTIKSVRNEIEHSTTFFVPPEDPVEIWSVTLKNHSGRRRKLKLFSYLQWHLSSYPFTWTDPQVYISPHFLAGPKAILVYNHNPESLVQYGGFMASDRPPEGFDTSMSNFLGPYSAPDSPRLPRAVLEGKCTSKHRFADPYIASLQHDLVIPPGGEVTVHYLVGVALQEKDVARLKRKYLVEGEPEKWFRITLDERKKLNDAAMVHTPDEDFDRYFNYWLKNQLLIVRNWCRGDIRGYRDVLQDLRGSMPLDPQWARPLLLQTMSFQYQNGTAPRQWNQLGGPHDLRNYKDSPSWIPDTLTAYIKETGDFDVLNEVIGYFDGGSGTVYEHALRAVRCLMQERGRHGICLMGHGDWNDALNEIGKGGQGESVWLACAMCYACLKMEALARRIGDEAVAAEMRAYYETMKRIINRVAWDGEWYIYAFSDDGTPVGSNANKEGKTHLNVQTWAVFTGVAEDERLKAVLKRIDEMDTELGPVLLYPCYKSYDPKIGRITGMVWGAFENGAVYTHGAAFKMRADCAAGRADQAYETFRKVTPLNPANPPERSTLEPFGLSNFYVGPENPENFGKALYSYLSGSGNWLFITALEHLLGVEADYDGLRIHPLLPKNWNAVRVERRFRDAVYNIEIKRKAGAEGVQIRCDGKKIEGNLVPAFADGKVHNVEVIVP